MSAKRVRDEALRASVDFLARLGFVTMGSKGVEWTHVADEKFRRAAKKRKPLR